MNPTLPAPTPPTDLTPENVMKYMITCRDTVKENLQIVEQYQEAMVYMAKTIDQLKEIIDSQNKDVEDVEDYLKRLNKHQNEPTFSNVATKVVQAVSAIFFFLLHLLHVAFKMMTSTLDRCVTIIPKEMSC